MHGGHRLRFCVLQKHHALLVCKSRVVLELQTELQREEVTLPYRISLHKYRELQERMNYVNDSGEFQDVESICSGKLSHVPSQPAFVPSLGGMPSRDQSLRPETGNLPGTSGNVFDSPRAVIESSSTPYQGTLHSWNQSATGENPVRENTGKPVATSEERIRETIPTPRFVRRPSTTNSLFPAEGVYPQNHVADQSRPQISELQFGKFSTPSTFSCWEIRFKTQVSACSSSPSEAMLWIKEVEMVDSVNDFETSRYNSGLYSFPNFEMLDARIASALNKIIQNSYFKKKVSLEEQKAQKRDRFLRGRRIAYMIYDYFLVSGAPDTVLDYADQFTVTLRNDDVQEFDTRWDEILLSMTKIPPDDVLESFYKLRVRESSQLKTVLELYDMEIHRKISKPNYQKMKTMAKRSIDQKLRLRNFDARNDGIEAGGGVNAVLKEGNENAINGEQKDSVREETSIVSGTMSDTKTTSPSEPPSQRGRSASSKKNRGRSPTVKFARQPCKDNLKGICTKSPCDSWHPPERQFDQSESG